MKPEIIWAWIVIVVTNNELSCAYIGINKLIGIRFQNLLTTNLIRTDRQLAGIYLMSSEHNKIKKILSLIAISVKYINPHIHIDSILLRLTYIQYAVKGSMNKFC